MNADVAGVGGGAGAAAGADAGETRVMTPETLERYMRAVMSTRHPLSGAPLCELFIEPAERLLRLRTPATSSYPEIGTYDRLTFDVVEEPGHAGTWFELSVDAEGMGYEAYSLIMSVVDQLEAGQPFKNAVSEALASFRELLSKRKKMSDEQEIGLFGELGVFAHLVDTMGEERATSAWLGPENEEHDFVLPTCDLEVKTTRTEARVHMIGSATQLARSPERPLYLVSIQMTAAGAARTGETLPERVWRVRSLLDRSVRVFDERLRSLGWDDRTAEQLYTRKYIARSEPRAYFVDDEFPAISPDGIAAIVARPELVVGLVYRIDVTNLEACEPPAEIVGLCEGATQHGA